MARLRNRRRATGYRVLVVDDDKALRNSTARLLGSEGHEVRTAGDAERGLELARTWRPHLLLLDYYMPGRSGADVVRAVREFDPIMQVLLVTGYAAEYPARQLLAELDIQGYHDKADGSERLLILIDAALKQYQTLNRLERQRGYLRHVLDGAPEITRLQSPVDMMQSALEHARGLLAKEGATTQPPNNGLFVLGGDGDGSVHLRAAMGELQDIRTLQQAPDELAHAIRSGLSAPRPTQHGRYVVLPLRTSSEEQGCMILEGGPLPDEAVYACELYTRQVVQAFENILLYERATVDPLTGLLRRCAGIERLDQTLRLASRTETETSVLMIDLDLFKDLNDQHGHAAGDLALKRAAETILSTCRGSDVACRYGGEEILLVLPATAAPGALAAAERVRIALEAMRIPFHDRVLGITASIGVSTAPPGTVSPMAWIERADRAMYEAKAAGRNAVRTLEAEPGIQEESDDVVAGTV
jgi:diguanylate cyclase (GGDEF)-like protein